MEFFGRLPEDTSKAIEEFSVHVAEPGISAEARVWSGYGIQSHPAFLFAELAADWKGDGSERSWAALERELKLTCTSDRFGHVFMRVELRPQYYEFAWFAEVTITLELGQLESLAKRAKIFFGNQA